MADRDVPRFFRVRQVFPRPRVDDLRAAARAELDRALPPGSVAEGASIGVTVGSRGITRIAEIARVAVEYLAERGAKPFIIPAMGSHGGAAAEAQEHLLGHYGVTEESMGCPIRSSMETVSLGTTRSGVDARVAKAAVESDGILLLNRVKPHTDYKGPLESGLAKICAIGLGKYDGAKEIHSHLFTVGLGQAIREVAEEIVAAGKVVGGLAVLENAYHETARFAGVPRDGLFGEEEGLLEEARGLMGKLPLDEIEVLYCERLGKNISGAGLDTNITGRSVYGYIHGEPWCEGMASILRIVVSDLADESDGNAVGMGQCEYITRRFADKIDHRVTSLNAMTACAPMGARLPVVLENDREALLAGIRTARRRPEGPRVVYVRDTLELERVYLSEACMPLVEGRDDIVVETEPAPLEFDATGHVVSPLR